MRQNIQCVRFRALRRFRFTVFIIFVGLWLLFGAKSQQRSGGTQTEDSVNNDVRRTDYNPLYRVNENRAPRQHPAAENEKLDSEQDQPHTTRKRRARPLPGSRSLAIKNEAVELVFKTQANGGAHVTAKLASVKNLLTGVDRALNDKLFEIVSYAKQSIKSDDCNVSSIDTIGTSGANLTLDCPLGHTVFWSAYCDPAHSFMRIRLQWKATDLSVNFMPHYVIALQQSSSGVAHQGSVLGSPFLHRPSLMYFAAEHPLGISGVMMEDDSTAICGTSYLPRPKNINMLNNGLNVIIGSVSEYSQLRREFGKFIETTRAHQSRPFLHYNSWFDFSSWQEPNASLHYRNMTEKICLDRVNRFGQELVVKRGVKMDSFLWDDGWDNQSSLWDFNLKTFPHGFNLVGKRAKEFQVGTGVWVSPWGGYGEAKDSRLAYAEAKGYEIGDDGFLLSGPKYFHRFKEIMLSMVTKYGVNMFKVDGIGFEGNHTVIATEMEGMLNLVKELRSKSLDKHIFISLTTGTWPSPFWLQYGDSVWRGHGDIGLEGYGSRRQQWITYRDAVVYHLVVRRARLFPLSGLMLHGIILGAVGQSRAASLDSIGKIEHFEQEVWSYFAMGVCLQELYVSPDLMTPQTWDIVAEAAKWARLRHPVLLDAHWIGSDPLKSPYGFASWSAEQSLGILLLRNPEKISSILRMSLREAFEISGMVAKTTTTFRFSRIYGPKLYLKELKVHDTVDIKLPPLSVVLLEAHEII